MQSGTSALIGLGVGLGITIPIVLVLSVLTYIRCRKYYKSRRRRNDDDGGEEQYAVYIKRQQKQHTTAKSPPEVNSPPAICRNRVPTELAAPNQWYPERPKPVFEPEPRRRSDFSFIGPSSAGEIELHRNWTGVSQPSPTQTLGPRSARASERGKNRFRGLRSLNNTNNSLSPLNI